MIDVCVVGKKRISKIKACLKPHYKSNFAEWSWGKLAPFNSKCQTLPAAWKCLGGEVRRSMTLQLDSGFPVAIFGNVSLRVSKRRPEE